MTSVAESLDTTLRMLVDAHTHVCHECKGRGAVSAKPTGDGPLALTAVAGVAPMERCGTCEGSGVVEPDVFSPSIAGTLCTIILRDVVRARKAEAFGHVDELLDWAERFLAVLMASTTPDEIVAALSDFREQVAKVQSVRSSSRAEPVAAHGALSEDELLELLAVEQLP